MQCRCSFALVGQCTIEAQNVIDVLKKKLVVTRRLTARQRLRRQQVNGKTKGRAGVVDGQIRGGTGKAGRPDLSVHVAIHVLAALRCRGTCRQHHRGSSGRAL